jgi:hypothetical protein
MTSQIPNFEPELTEVHLESFELGVSHSAQNKNSEQNTVPMLLLW